MLQSVRLPTRRSGVAAVELAIVMIVLVPLLMGLWEVGRLVNVHQAVMSAAREAGRQGSTGIKTNNDIKNVVLAHLRNANYTSITALATDAADLKNNSGKVLVEIKIYDANGKEQTNLDGKNSLQNYKIEILVSIMYKDIRYSSTNAFLNTSTQISARVFWRCMKDQPVVVNDTIPYN